MQVILRRWYVIALFILAGLVVAYLNLRYTKPLYTSSVNIKFDDDKGTQMSDIFRYGKVSGRIENQLKTEAEIFKSRTLALQTIKAMDYRIAYFQKGQIVTSEIYPFPYFKVQPLFIDSSDFGKSFNIQFINSSSFSLRTSEKNPSQTYQIGDSIFIGSSIISITRDASNKNGQTPKSEYICRFVDPEIVASAISNGIEVELEKGTSILRLSYVSDVPDKAADVVNTTAQVYIKENVLARAQAAEQTIRFIDGLIEDLANQVNQSQQNLTDFQAQNSGVELSEVGKAEFEKLNDMDAQKNLLLLKKRMLVKLSQQLKETNNKTLELVLLDPEDAQELPEMLQLLNGLILDRLSLSQKSLSNSPVMVENERKIAEVKSALARALVSAQSKLDEKINYTNRLLNDAQTKLAGLPQKQQALLNLERNFKVNEKIYGYLMEKKLETRISKSSIIANSSIIDQALVPNNPFYPVAGRTYAIAFLIGLALGVSSIFILRFIYNRIPDKETIEALSKTPVIGVIKKLDHEEMEDNYELYVMKSPKSVFSESVRGIRTNINFILKGDNHKVVCVTSSVSGEGKTFCTVNLAASLTLLGHKVVVVGCDLRRPKIHLTFRNMSNEKGVTTYLIGKHSLEDIIQPSEFENLDVIPAGPTPPNPSELLQTERMTDLVNILKKEYDYVFFDTAPVGLVSDSFSLMTQADINLFIIRSQYSRRDFAVIPDRLKLDNNIPNIYTILNSYDNSSAVYGSIYKTAYGGYYGGGGYYYYGGYYNKGYGYYARKYYSQYYQGYYGDEHLAKPWWHKLVKKSKKKRNRSNHA
jgi:capsular exopolysaccharide synthesis family protein